MIRAENFLLSVLDAIEQVETRLLVWGYVDGYFSETELEDLVYLYFEDALDQDFEEFLSMKEITEALLKRALIVKVEPKPGHTGYRSRMAETVRLLLRLRQLFPKHDSTSDGWQQAATLVADYRFKWRQREYPRRDILHETALDQIQQASPHPAVHAGARALLNPDFHLSGFQLRATRRVLRGLANREKAATDRADATIVCAGTGSGKTLSFYLPALASIVHHRADAVGSKPWVKVVAIYPRTELLKDQLREVLVQSRRLDQVLAEMRQRPVRIGALYSDTPTHHNTIYWEKHPLGYQCPFLRCPACQGPLVWTYEDARGGHERLVCSAEECGGHIKGSRLALTRESMEKDPPDILFTTTEMLNQRLSDSRVHHLFGVGPRAERGPELVLLDEVHTYESRYGAQVAYLMRRWRHLIGRPVCCVGLSATLREAAGFFSSLTGIQQNYVEEISPETSEMETEGAEYQLVLRGDPISRTALLSTSIQTVMLLQRSLDSRRDPLSQGVFGKRSFVFTDNLDANNRLYFDLLSAEGRDSWQRPDHRRAPQGGLAVLRKERSSHARYRYGQDWRMCETLKHDLSDRLMINRVSSQDRGIVSNTDVIVATAALEVGFDDPDVGAVIQHKAPRGMASFMQRKGRAGRKRGMRPWTAVVLSDYGRDRVSYQNYDQLFDPELPVRTLPLTNRYVTRMQAVFAMIDMLGQRLADSGQTGSVWRSLSVPAKGHENRGYVAKVADSLKHMLETRSGTKTLEDYLCKALRLKSSEVQALLWEYPRPLIMSALPTALRRLESHWRAHGEPGQDLQAKNNPLPDFIPATLFSDLNLAEVEIVLLGEHWQKSRERPAMSVLAAIREFAPGRVSRRYGLQKATERYWLGPDSSELQVMAQGTTGNYRLDIEKIGTFASMGRYQMREADGRVTHIDVVRPRVLAPQSPPKEVADSSNASLLWSSQLVPLGEPILLAPPSGDTWQKLLPSVSFFTHAQHAPVEVRRFASGASGEVSLGAGESISLRTSFGRGDHPVALGLGFAADGVMFRLELPQQLHALGGKNAGTMWRALRTSRYFAMAWSGEVLESLSNPFMREWLAQIYLSALTFECIKSNISLEEAAKSLADGTATMSLIEVLEQLFQSTVVDDQGERQERSGQDRLRQDLVEALRDPNVMAELERLGRALWGPVDAEWEPLLRSTFQATLAAAIQQAMVDLCPTIDLDALVVDLDRGPRPNGENSACDAQEIWITENSPGGSGLIEEFLRHYSEDPRRFFAMVGASLEMSEFELTDHQLGTLLNQLADSSCRSGVKSAVQDLRRAHGHGEITTSHRQLRRELARTGTAPYHGFLVALGNRIARPGAGPESDAFLANAITQWTHQEERLGLEIDLRIVAYWLAQFSDIDAVASQAGVSPPSEDLTTWRMSAIYGLLWARGRTIRQAALPLRSPYAAIPATERLLVKQAMKDERIRIPLEAEDWLERAFDNLSRGQLVTLTTPLNKRQELSRALRMLATNPAPADYLQAYARLQGVRQLDDTIEADIELPEAGQ